MPDADERKLFWAKPVRTRGGIERSLLFNTESDSFYLLIKKHGIDKSIPCFFFTRFLSWFLLSIKSWAWLLDICINYRKTGTFLVCLGELVHCNMVGNHMVPQTQWNTGLHWSRHTSNTRTCSCNSTGLVQLNYFSGVLVLAYNTTCCKRTVTKHASSYTSLQEQNSTIFQRAGISKTAKRATSSPIFGVLQDTGKMRREIWQSLFK